MENVPEVRLPALGEVRFHISVISHLSLPKAEDIHYENDLLKIKSIETRQTADNAYSFFLFFDEADAGEWSNEKWIQARDAFCSALSATAMVPVTLATHGVINRRIEADKHSAMSLGYKNLAGGERGVSLSPLMEATNEPEAPWSTLQYFFWQGLQCKDELSRFMNLAVAVDILASEISESPKSEQPKCIKCSAELKTCPACGENWPAKPVAHLEHVKHVLGEELGRQFVTWRNNVFHAKKPILGRQFDPLHDINRGVILAIGQQLAARYGIETPVTEESLSPALFPPAIAMKVYFTHPG